MNGTKLTSSGINLTPATAKLLKVALIPATIGAAIAAAGEVGESAMLSQGVPQDAAATFRDGGMAAIGAILSLTVLGNLFIQNEKLKFFFTTVIAGLSAFFAMQKAQDIEIGSPQWNENAKVIIPLLLAVLGTKNLAGIAVGKYSGKPLAAALTSVATEIGAVQAGGRTITASGAMPFNEGANAFSAMILTASPLVIALLLFALVEIDRRTVQVRAPIDLDAANIALLANDGVQLSGVGGAVAESDRAASSETASDQERGEYSPTSPVRSAMNAGKADQAAAVDNDK
ncbi:MAG: hypothetical protein K0R66_63 [Gammaproteobacteria bacterium]|jgi:hypothetical protein|nr:hypothetical protein [Gammaproteobacteria bacterium]